MKKTLYPLFLAALAAVAPAGAANYTSLAVSGSAVEEGGDFAMTEIISDPSRPSLFVAYLQLNPGTFTLSGTMADGTHVALGTGASQGILADGGQGVEVTETGIVRLTLDAGSNNLEILPISSLGLKGSIVPDDVTLDYAGRGVWRSTVTLDQGPTTDYPSRYFYFLFNNDESLAVKRHWDSFRVDMPSHGISVENIRLNQGTYEITLDMASHTFAVDAEIDPMKVSVFGSSVANGSGATSMEGYAYLYGEQLKQRYAAGTSPNPFYTSGVSIGGNNTNSLLNRYDDVIRDFSNYVVIGLSLGNEGIHDSQDLQKQQEVFNRWRDNMLTLISRLRADGKQPVVVNNYTRSDFTASDYNFVKQLNLLIHEWDVPSVNSLGSIDDGEGRWSQGYINDPAHPNTLGHVEFMHAFVPSLFDALIDGKPQPERDLTASATLENGNVITLAPEERVHPFTICVRVKGSEAGQILSFGHGAGSRPFTGSVNIDANGAVVYNSPLKAPVTSAPVMADGEWHDIALSHYFARGCTLLYIDGQPVGTVDERLTLGNVTFGDNTPAQSSREFAEIAFWRAGMNTEEMTAHHQGKMLKSSLEIYSPVAFASDGTIANLAQSTNALETDSSASLAAVTAETDGFSATGGAGAATVFSNGTVERVYTIDGRLAATVTATPAGTRVNLTPGLYMVRNIKVAVI
ncbi:MAG: SGNH/GDSL hydrolase family protein [Muribaculaceae bacterium]|nr:SGNH/GDSL hydrolase family protein [Muribaculaceae bacterium]